MPVCFHPMAFENNIIALSDAQERRIRQSDYFIANQGSQITGRFLLITHSLSQKPIVVSLVLIDFE